MNKIIEIFSLRGTSIFISTSISLLIVLLALNVVTSDNLASILGLSQDASNALQQVVSRLQELTHNIIDIISQLIKKILFSFGIDNGIPLEKDIIKK